MNKRDKLYLLDSYRDKYEYNLRFARLDDRIFDRKLYECVLDIIHMLWLFVSEESEYKRK